MYFWASWFDRRYRLIVYLAVAVALAVLATLPAGLERHEGRWIMARITSPAQVISIWHTGIGHTLVALLVALLFIAADLGVLGWGDDPERTNLDFLMSRPRSRSHLVWTAWLAGLTQLLPLLVLPLLTCLGILRAMTHALLPEDLLQLSAPLFTMVAAMYTLAFFMATVTASARQGYELAALVVILYWGVHFAGSRGFYYDWDRLYLFGAFDWYLSPHQIFPLANLLFVAGVILLLPYLAQLSFVRRDL